MQDQDIGITLHQRLLSLKFPADERAQMALRDDVWNFVDDRKLAGWPPERVIIAVKAIAREAGLNPSTLIVRRDAPITTLDEVLVEIVGWCIHRYYEHD